MKMSIRALLTLFTALVAFSQAAFAVVYPLPPKDSRLVGENIQITVPEDSKLPLESFAAQYQMGLSNMLEANPGVDPFLPKAGSTLTIPQQLILPDAPREGIIINSAEMRLYYYPKGPNTVVVLPIGIGQLGKDTPLNWTTTVQRKKDGPTWTPTAKMRAEYAADGEILPAVFPAGPDNPMGLYALYVGRLYAIHGTNANFGIGLRVSHGCASARRRHQVPVRESAGRHPRAVHQRTDESHRRTGRLALRGSAQPAVGQRRAAAIERSGAADHLRAGRQVLMDAGVNQSEVDAAIKARSGMPVKVN